MYSEYSFQRVFENGDRTDVSVSCLSEYQMDLYVNGTFEKSFLCTRMHREELIIGYLIGKGMIRTAKDVRDLKISEDSAYLTVCENAFSEASGPEEDHPEAVDPDPEQIRRIIRESVKEQRLHRKTSAAHGAYLFFRGEPVFVCEDLGRHNALDKSIGYLYINGYDPNECAIYTTGRLQSDSVKKLVNAGIPLVLSKSVPTVQALEIAHKQRICLICRAWPDSYDILK